MMLNDRIQNLNSVQHVLRKAEDYLIDLAPETPYSNFEHKFQEIGLERERLGQHCRIPMVFNVVILSPHAYFALDNVLGYPHTGGGGQVPALEKEMLLRIKQQGLDITNLNPT